MHANLTGVQLESLNFTVNFSYNPGWQGRHDLGVVGWWRRNCYERGLPLSEVGDLEGFPACLVT